MKNLNNRSIIRVFEIQEIYGISKSTAYRLMNKNKDNGKKFPKLIRLSSRCTGWRKKDLDEYFI